MSWTVLLVLLLAEALFWVLVLRPRRPTTGPRNREYLGSPRWDLAFLITAILPWAVFLGLRLAGRDFEEALFGGLATFAVGMLGFFSTALLAGMRKMWLRRRSTPN